jgi:predicted NUDIX family NTP pyrophosphohydrolase
VRRAVDRVSAVSAGLLLYRRRGDEVEVLIAHPGGPLFARRDDGWWSIPKGLADEGEALEATACREFVEETGFDVPDAPLIPLGDVRLRSGKRVHAWAVEGDADPAALASNTFVMTWPPGMGTPRTFEEIDRVVWADPAQARRALNREQAELVDRLLKVLAETAH